MVDDALQRDLRLGDKSLVVRPAGLNTAAVTGHTPVPMAGVVAKDVADARAVQMDRRAANDVEVDVDRLGDRPGHIAHDAVDANGRPMRPRRVDRHDSRHLEQRGAPGPGRVLGEVEGLAASKADHRGERRQVGHDPIEFCPLERPDEQRTGQPVVELAGEARPQVGHRHDEIGPMHIGLQLGDQPSTVDGVEQFSHHIYLGDGATMITPVR